jgi:hypothetical protein
MFVFPEDRKGVLIPRVAVNWGLVVMQIKMIEWGSDYDVNRNIFLSCPGGRLLEGHDRLLSNKCCEC